jgi:hypothetical protein
MNIDNEYNNKLNFFCKTYNIDVLNSKKNEFRYFCFKYIEYSRGLKLPTIKKNQKKEAVLIEMRNFPHIEFLIRNTILKLGENWSHTIICGRINYELVKKICESISKNIKIIKLERNNLSVQEYSLLLSSNYIWSMLEGEKILIYQEDSCIFKSNIDDFIKWDYIGAPWPKEKDDTPNCVGNGGFSLRTKKCMEDVIKKKYITNFNLNSSTIDYMNCTNLKYAPEDVYFSKTMQEENIGNVADWQSAYEFSSESITNPDSLGGHNFFDFDNKWKERMYKYVVHLEKDKSETE